MNVQTERCSFDISKYIELRTSHRNQSFISLPLKAESKFCFAFSVSRSDYGELQREIARAEITSVLAFWYRRNAESLIDSRNLRKITDNRIVSESDTIY